MGYATYPLFRGKHHDTNGRGIAPPVQNDSIEMCRVGHVDPALRNRCDNKRSVGVDDFVRPND